MMKSYVSAIAAAILMAAAPACSVPTHTAPSDAREMPSLDTARGAPDSRHDDSPPPAMNAKWDAGENGAQSPLPRTTVDVTPPENMTAPVPLGPDAAFDLDASVKRGLAVNPRIMATRYQLLGAEDAIRAARAAFGFAATFSYGYEHAGNELKQAGVTLSPQDVFSMNLNVTQPLFTGFRLLSAYQRSKLARDQAKAQIEATELSLILQIQTNFLALLQARQNVHSAQDSVTRLKAQLNTTKSFFHVGIRPQLDVLQAETDLAQAEQDLLVAEDAVQTQMARLNTLLNLPVDNPTNYVGELEYVPFTMRLAEGLSTAYRFRPDLIIAQKGVEIAEQEADVAKSGLYPQVNAAFNYNRQGDSPDVSGFGSNTSLPQSDWNVGMNMQWRVFDWGQTYYAYKSAAQNIPRLQSEYLDLRLEATNAVQRDHLQIQDASKRTSVARTALEAAREAFRLAEARYKEQVATSVDVLAAQASLTQAEVNLTQALADYQTAIAKFYSDIGVRKIDLLP